VCREAQRCVECVSAVLHAAAGAGPDGPGLPGGDRLRAPFKIFQPDVSPFRVEAARKIACWNQAAGLPEDCAVPVADRARIRSELAREFFVAEHGREPMDARELAATIAKHSRPRTQAVAGYDLTFSLGEVKSVSAPSIAPAVRPGSWRREVWSGWRLPDDVYAGQAAKGRRTDEL
jgi:hypothetical protein